MTAVDADLSGFLASSADGRPRLELLVRGAHCASCLSKVEKAAASVPGVVHARFNLTTGKLLVEFKAGRPDATGVISAVSDAGYVAIPYDPATARDVRDAEGRRLTLALGVAGFGVGNTMMFSVPIWAGLFGQELDPSARAMMYWLSAIVAAPCALYAGSIFFESALRSLRRGKANMDVPISIGVILTLLVSFSEIIQGGRHAYFDAAVSLVFLLLIGRWLDHKLRARAMNAARDLLSLQAPVAQRLDADGVEQGVPVSQVAVGDLIAVAPGNRAPVDGVVVEGASSIDNALVTGETAPWLVGPGSALHAGALNIDGRLVIRVQGAGAGFHLGGDRPSDGGRRPVEVGLCPARGPGGGDLMCRSSTAPRP